MPILKDQLFHIIQVWKSTKLQWIFLEGAIDIHGTRETPHWLGFSPYVNVTDTKLAGQLFWVETSFYLIFL